MKACIVLFDQKDVDLVKQYVASHGENFDELIVVSIVPGIDLTRLSEKNIICLSCETILGSLSQSEISLKCTEMVDDFINNLKSSFVQDRSTFKMIDALSNMSALWMHIPLQSLEVLKFVVDQYSVSTIITKQASSRSLIYPERPDVKNLYRSSVLYPHLVHYFCHEHSIHYKSITHLERFSAWVTKARSFLLNIYKFKVLLQRVLRCKKSTKLLSELNNTNKKTVLLIVRAQSEWDTVSQLYNEMQAGSQFSPVIVQDDLIKNPSGLLALKRANVNFLPIHQFSSIFGLCATLIRSIRMKRELRKKLEHVNTSCLLQLTRACTMASAQSFFELNVFSDEMEKAIDALKPFAIITMDMVDQWCAALGLVAKRKNVFTAILQNTCLDDIYYPKPVSTDVMWLSTKNEYNIILKSLKRNCQPIEKVALLGSPLYDQLYTSSLQSMNFKSKRQELNIPPESFVITVATQPFAQGYPYNEKLIEHLLALSKTIVNSKPIVIVIKPHPREHAHIYQRYTTIDSNVSVRCVFDCDIVDLICMSDLFVSRTSTSLQTALLLGVPLLSYLENYPKDICQRLEYLGCDATIKANDFTELQEAVQQFYNTRKAKQDFKVARQYYIDHYFGYFDGQSSQRIANSLSSIDSRECYAKV